MKKIFAIILSMALLATMSVTAFAAENSGSITTGSGSQEIELSATYVPGSSQQTVYKVDVEWGSMEFTYTGVSAGTWNPDTHTYDGKTYKGTWSCEADANKIKVTNHSNAAVTVSLACELPSGIDSAFSSADGDTITSLSLATAEGTSVGNPPAAVAYFNVPSGIINQSGKLGTITITIE